MARPSVALQPTGMPLPSNPAGKAMAGAPRKFPARQKMTDAGMGAIVGIQRSSTVTGGGHQQDATLTEGFGETFDEFRYPVDSMTCNE